MNWTKDKYGVMVLATFGSLLLDQLTKAIVIAKLPANGFLHVIPGLFDLYTPTTRARRSACLKAIRCCSSLLSAHWQ